MSKRKTFLIAGAAVSGIVILGAATVTFMNITKAKALEKDTTSSMNQLQGVYNRSNPFPSPENIQVQTDALELIKEQNAKLFDALTKRAIDEDKNQTPGSFAKICEDTILTLRSKAPKTEGGAFVIANEFNFGFDRYDTSKNGNPASDSDVPRLMRQLKMIEALVPIFYDAEIIKLDSVLRDEFDSADSSKKGSSSRSSSRGSSRRGSSSRRVGSSSVSVGDVKLDRVSLGEDVEDSPIPLNCQRFGFVFTTKEAGLYKVLDAVTAMWPFAMVSSLEFQKVGKDVVFPSSENEKDEEEAPMAIIQPPAGKTSRIISGALREAPLKVALTVDVFTFVDETDTEADSE